MSGFTASEIWLSIGLIAMEPIWEANFKPSSNINQIYNVI
jgi:hypothetical protein